MKVYIATKLANAKMHNELRDMLMAEGHTVTYDWTKHCSVKNDGEERLREVANLEASGVIEADVVIVLLPGGRGTHAELGMAIGADKPVIIYDPQGKFFKSNDDTCAFYWHSNCTHVTGKSLNMVNWALALSMSIL